MNHVIASLFRRNRRAFSAALLSYLLIAGQTAPLVLAAARRAAPASAASQTSPPAGARAAEIPSLEVTAAAPAPAPLAPAAALVPTITATKVDTVIAANGIDPDPDGIADPDQLIEYQVVITNNGTTATNVTFNDTVDVNTTLQGASIKATPLAGTDSYNVLGNVRIQVPDGASDLLANDQDPDTGNNTGMTVVAETKKSAECVTAGASCPTNNVTINADGSFSYDPPPGYTGGDSFTYTPVSSGDNGSAGTVNLTVSGMVWFVNDDDPVAGGDGRLTNPFNCLVGTGCFSDSTLDEASDNIFLFVGTYNNTGALTLLNTQKLIGQGASDTLATIAGVTVPPHSDALPTTNEPAGTNPTPPLITSTANGINLGQNNVLRGFSVGNVGNANRKINGSGFGQLTVGKTGAGEADVFLSGTGMALFLLNGTIGANSAFNTVATTGSTTQGILLSQITAGTLNFAGVTIAGATGNGIEVNGSQADINFGNTDVSAGTNGVVLANNSAGTRTFGTLTITGGSGIGFSHSDPDGAGAGTGGGAVTVSGAMNVINPAGNGIDIQNSNANLSFAATTVSKGSTANIGVNLVNNPSRTIGFTQLSSTTTNAFALQTNNSGTVNAGGGSLTQNGAGGGAATLTNTVLGLTFNTVSSTSGGNGLIFSGGSGAFTTGSTNLQSNAGVGLLMSSTSIAASFGNTTVNSSAGDAVDISGQTGNVTFADLDLTPDANLRGLDVSNTSGTITSTSGDIATTGAPALNISGPAGRTPLALALTDISVTNSTTLGIDLNLVSGAITLASGGTGTEVNISNPTGIGIQIRNSGTGTMNFGDTTVTGSGGTGVVLGTAGNGNSANITFADLDINPDGGQRAFHSVQNTGTITTLSGDIITTTGISVEIVGTSSGSRAPLNMTLNRVSANGASNGIILTNTNGPGASVGFVVNGDGTNTSVGGNDSGGVIQNTTGGDDDSPADAGGTGVRLVDVDEVILRRMTLTTQANYGIYGERVTGFTFEFSKLNGINGTATGINNTNNPDATVYFNELTGAALFKDAIIEGGLEDNVRILNTSGTLNRVDFNNVTFGVMDAGNALGDNSLFIQARNAAVVNVTIQNSDLTHARGDMFQFDLTNTASGDLIFDNNTVNNTHPNVVTGGGGITLSGGGSATANTNLTYEFDNNTFRGARGSALLILMQTGAGSASGRIEGNTFGVTGVLGSCSSEATCVEIRTEGRGAQTALVNNNTIQQYANNGIYFEFDGINTGSSTGTVGQMNATVTNNIVREPVVSGANAAGIHFNFGASAADTYQGCADVRTNDAPNAGGEASDAERDYILRQRAATTIRLPGYAGAAGDEAAVEAFIQAQNTGAETVFAAETTAGTPPNQGGGFTGGAACSQPPAGAVFFNASNISGGGGDGFGTLGAPEQTSLTSGGGATSFGGGVTSQPFVSMPLGTTQTTTAQTVNTLAPVQQPQQTTLTATEPQQGTPIEAANVTQINPPVISGNNINWNLGTLHQGQSVTITFRVKVNNPYAGGANVSNQGSVTCTECGAATLTDDTALGGASDPTLTPVNAPPDIVVKDASGPEPPSGSSPMAFTVVLSKAAATNVVVNFSTAEDTGGTDPATEGVDFTPTSGQLTFLPGQTVQTISVPVLHDNDAPEPDETFLVNLDSATGGNITDGAAVGTITANNPAGAILISEIRTFGPGGAGDDFVEVYNNTGAAHTVTASDASAGYGIFRLGATCADTPVLIGTIPNTTVIPARGHFLLVGSQYSLGAVASGNLTMSTDLGENANVGIFNTDNVANLSTATRLDAVGFSPNTTGNNCDLLREGGALPPVNSATPGLGNHSFYRSLCSFVNGVGCTVANPGFPEDRNNNATDFLFVDTNATSAAGAGQQRLGAPGPENMLSARVNDNVLTLMLDGTKTSTAVPNRVRRQCADPLAEECDPNRSKLGTMSIRRRLQNNTGQTVTQLRVRVAEITTAPWAGAPTADVRALSSLDVVVTGINDAATCAANGTPATVPCSVTVKGTTVQAPTQTIGGGYNTTMIVTLPGGGLLINQSVSLQFLLGVQESGNFRFLVNVEALP